MKSKLYLFISFVLLAVFSFSVKAQYSTIRTNVFNDLQSQVSTSALNSLANTYYVNLLTDADNNDSTWVDINYKDPSISTWQPMNHISRLQYMALAYTRSGSLLYQNRTLISAITKALAYWNRVNPICKNWYFNALAVPNELGQLLIILSFGNTALPSPLFDALTIKLNRGDLWKSTGANKTYNALAYMYRASLTNNVVPLDSAVTAFRQEVTPTTLTEGLQYDNSFLQHGPQMYIDNYGFALWRDEFQGALYLLGTSYAFSGSALESISNFLLNAHLKAFRGKYSDFNVVGRQIGWHDILDKSSRLSNLQQAKLVNSAHSVDYDAAIARFNGTKPASYGIVASHQHYYKADFTNHVRPAYSFNVRTNSTRTCRTEWLNNENLKGNFLPDGATNIQRRGDEYFNIFPAWKWDKVPGITCRSYTVDKTMPGMNISTWLFYGSTSFVGGVSDSIYGASTYQMNYNGVSARKSWFFFDKEVVCLGAGITSTAAEAIHSTVNQCLRVGSVQYKDEAGSVNTIALGDSIAPVNAQWALQDSIGYFFPSGGNINITNRTQTGTWISLASAGSSTLLSKDVFKLWMNHGIKPTNGSYSYIVVPEIANTTAMNSYNLSNIQIIANTASLQAVKNNELNILQVIFSAPGTVTDPISGLTITVDKACVLMAKNVGINKVTVSIADPTQLSTTINLSLKFSLVSTAIQRIINMPIAPYKGATTTIAIDASLTTIKGNAANENITLFPNPGSSIINICLPQNLMDRQIKLKLKLITLDGKVLEQKNVTKEIEQLSIDQYSAGSYFVQVISEGEVIAAKRLIVVK
jgi:chondroitin AC lyase